ncbi:hypothetical protein SAMN05216232_0454 [Virgibacillus subterraneus]|uniref:Uncharacterized protein n=2 Tax=Virgibacillus TaxID=84406 RepID=A0A1H0XZI0_9BACI|nr:hypothetical protein SAMN05216231_0325 [Virgibacillus salinus]SEP64357.1 hypothetical protein SAMN05216232_0454 [Virgibacillus subterraneus]
MHFLKVLKNSRVFRILTTSVAWSTIILLFFFIAAIVYLLIMDYFYNEDKDKFNQNGEEITLQSSYQS